MLTHALRIHALAVRHLVPLLQNDVQPALCGEVQELPQLGAIPRRASRNVAPLLHHNRRRALRKHEHSAAGARSISFRPPHMLAPLLHQHA